MPRPFAPPGRRTSPSSAATGKPSLRWSAPDALQTCCVYRESPFKPGCLVGLLARLVVRDDRFRKTGMLHSDAKIELFYKSVLLVLALTAVLLAITGGVVYGEVPAAAQIMQPAG